MKKLLILLCLLLVGCSNKLVGTYYYYTESGIKENVSYEFKSNNTGEYTFGNDSRTFTYKIVENVLEIKYDDKNMRTLKTEFVLENGFLKFKNSFGENVTYKKR